MPVRIECGCDGFHVCSEEGRDRKIVYAGDLKAVHLAVDHHYRRYAKNRKGHENGTVVGCPLCKEMTGEKN